MDNGFAPLLDASGTSGFKYNTSTPEVKITEGNANRIPTAKDSLLHALNRASAVIQKSTFSDEEFLKTFKDQLSNLGLNAAIFLLDPPGTKLIVHMTTFPAIQMRIFEKDTGLHLIGFKLPLTVLGNFVLIAREQKPFFILGGSSIIVNPADESVIRFKEMLKSLFGVSPAICAPLVVHRKLTGIVILMGEAISEEDLAPMEAFANHIAIALENLRLFTTIKENETKLKKQADDMGLINLLNDALNQKKPLPKILGLLVNETKRIFASYNASIWFYDRNKEELALQDTGQTPPVKCGIENLVGDNYHGLRIPLSKNSMYRKILSGMLPYLSNDEKDITNLINEFISGIKLRGKQTKLALSEFAPQLFKIINVLSVVIVPLGTEDDPIGLFEIMRSDPFGGEDLKRFDSISRQVTTVIKRKQDEDVLTMLSNAVEQSPAMVVISAPEGVIEYTNPTFTDVSGYTPADVIGKKQEILYSTDAGLDEYERIRDAVAKGDEWKGEMKRRKKNGDFFWEAASMSPIRNAEGEITHYLLIGMDITDQKRMEEELFRMRNLESLGLLAGGIAHDFNNILTGILGNINLARSMDPDEADELPEILLEAEKAALLAKDLTQQLLTFAKGGAPIKKPSSLVSLIKETTSFAFRGSKIEWTFDFPEDLSQVDVDRSQIAQVINNILINAEQSMEGCGRIEITAANIAMNKNPKVPLLPGRFVKISIKDNGTGIDDKNLSKIFNPYFTTKETGTGLGLAIAYSIINRHGGHISVESKLEVGTTFTIFLPVATKETFRKPSKPGKISSARGKILLVDDEELIRKVGTKLLGHIGYKTESARDSEEAILKLESAHAIGDDFQVVILDLSLGGGKTGKELLARLREINPGLKAIASSGYSQEGVMARFTEFGFDGIVIKPYKLDELSDTICQVMACE
jgi:PAS domain S-box-containing protein